MDISASTVSNSALFQVLDSPVNKDVSVVNPGVTFLPDAIMNKTASYSLKTKKVKTVQSHYLFLNLFFYGMRKS